LRSREIPFPIAHLHDHRPPCPCRFAGRSRPTFHTWPHASHRQYDDASALVLVVMIFGERQNGQVVGAGGAS
jgi:hypothetical protein